MEEHEHNWDKDYKENPNCLICTVCKMCYCQAREIELESQLAAANARVVELEKKSHEAFISSSNAIGFYTIAKGQLLAHEKQLTKRAEQAEKDFEDAKDKIAMMGAEIVRLSEGKEQAEARVAELEGQVNRLHKCLIFDGECLGEYQTDNKRMRELLVEIKSYAESYVDLNPRLKHIIDCAKAALEGKIQ